MTLLLFVAAVAGTCDGKAAAAPVLEGITLTRDSPPIAPGAGHSFSSSNDFEAAEGLGVTSDVSMVHEDKAALVEAAFGQDYSGEVLGDGGSVLGQQFSLQPQGSDTACEVQPTPRLLLPGPLRLHSKPEVRSWSWDGRLEAGRQGLEAEKAVSTPPHTRARTHLACRRATRQRVLHNAYVPQ